MRKASFLARLHDEKKLQIVEPSEEIKNAYLKRSDESLSSAKTLLKINNLKDAVALAYYSMYHCLLALLFRTGIKCENHSAAIILLRKVFGIDNTSILKAKSERVDKQYYVDFEVSKKEVSDAIVVAEEFISHITNFIETIREEELHIYRKKVTKLVKNNVLP